MDFDIQNKCRMNEKTQYCSCLQPQIVTKVTRLLKYYIRANMVPTVELVIKQIKHDLSHQINISS